MSKYYCPYCSPQYQIHKRRSDGVMICRECGDPLIKVPAIKATQIFAILVIAALTSPLIFILIGFLQEQKLPNPQTARSQMASKLL